MVWMADWLVWILIISYYGVVCWVDICQRRIPFFLILVGAAITGWIGIKTHGWQSALLGAAFSLGVFVIIFMMGKLWAGWKQQRQGRDALAQAFGFGDVLLAGVNGLLLGWPLIMTGILAGVAFTGIFILFRIGLAMLRREPWRERAIPLAPFLSAGVLFAALYWLFR
jgi:prepilin signal peptidase PulO-like enzyme (type II secretory pathway)